MALIACAVILGMTGLTAASVPLYNLFCRVTGYGGTTNVATAPDASPAAGGDVEVEVTFNADIDPGLPWRFQPLQRRMTVPVGESSLAFYEAVNLSDRAVVGRAVYNVTPLKIGYYFNKVHCFCFEEQTLEPGQRIEMPVSFFVDPAMLEDADGRSVRQITLSYTFFIDDEATEALARMSARAADGEAIGG